MSESKAMMAFAQDLFSGMGAVEVKRFFGGGGLYAGPTIFGLIIGGRIYLKTDAALAAEMAAEGSVPWIYTPRSGSRAGQPIQMRYMTLPSAAEDDPDEACLWGRRALRMAEAEPVKPRRRRKSSGPPSSL